MISPRFCPRYLLVAALGLPTALTAQQQVQFPAPSPASTLQQRVGLTDIEIVYSRPGVKGRQIFGELETYGRVWRTGANNATKLTFSTPVKLNGTDVPAGTYGLFSIPGESEWTIILNRNAEQWGAFSYDEKDDVARVTATPVQLNELVETFTIDINDIRDESATLSLIWEKTRVPIEIEVDVASTLVPQIEAVMAAHGDRKPYYPAAMFYYDHDLDLTKAREWIDAAVEQRAAYYIVHLQAKILSRLGEKENALAAARRSIELARAANDNGYVNLNEDFIASLQE